MNVSKTQVTAIPMQLAPTTQGVSLAHVILDFQAMVSCAQTMMNVHLIQTIAIPMQIVQTIRGVSLAHAILGFQAMVSRAQMMMNVHLIQTIAIPMQVAPIFLDILLAHVGLDFQVFNAMSICYYYISFIVSDTEFLMFEVTKALLSTEVYNKNGKCFS